MRWIRLSTQNPRIEQLLAERRNELVIFQQKASELSTKAFDDLSQQILQQRQMLQKGIEEKKKLQDLLEKGNTETKRLEDLLEKNNIQHKLEKAPTIKK